MVTDNAVNTAPTAERTVTVMWSAWFMIWRSLDDTEVTDNNKHSLLPAFSTLLILLCSVSSHFLYQLTSGLLLFCLSHLLICVPTSFFLLSASLFFLSSPPLWVCSSSPSSLPSFSYHLTFLSFVLSSPLLLFCSSLKQTSQINR